MPTKTGLTASDPAPREIGYLYAVKMSAVVEICCLGPEAPADEVKATLLANILDQIRVFVPAMYIPEVDDGAKQAAEGLVDSYELIEKRDLMTGEAL